MWLNSNILYHNFQLNCLQFLFLFGFAFFQFSLHKFSNEQYNCHTLKNLISVRLSSLFLFHSVHQTVELYTIVWIYIFYIELNWETLCLPQFPLNVEIVKSKNSFTQSIVYYFEMILHLNCFLCCPWKSFLLHQKNIDLLWIQKLWRHFILNIFLWS